MAYLRSQLTEEVYEIHVKAAIFRPEDMKASVLKSGNLHGFKTAAGVEVLRENRGPPRNGGGTFIFEPPI